MNVLWTLLSKEGKLRLHDVDVKYLEFKTFLVPLAMLREHEETIPERTKLVLDDILSEGCLRYPILVDARTLTVLDGHHRLEALRKLGVNYVPAFMVDYFKDYVRVGAFRKEFRVTKSLVIERALTGRKLPPRTSRHVLLGLKVYSTCVPLDALRDPGRGSSLPLLTATKPVNGRGL